jgi:hypothetical protein
MRAKVLSSIPFYVKWVATKWMTRQVKTRLTTRTSKFSTRYLCVRRPCRGEVVPQISSDPAAAMFPSIHVGKPMCPDLRIPNLTQRSLCLLKRFSSDNGLSSGRNFEPFSKKSRDAAGCSQLIRYSEGAVLLVSIPSN